MEGLNDSYRTIQGFGVAFTFYEILKKITSNNKLDVGIVVRRYSLLTTCRGMEERTEEQ